MRRPVNLAIFQAFLLGFLPSVLPGAGAQNLIENGGFESGHAPWTGAGTVGTTQAHGGLHALEFSPGQGMAEQIVEAAAGEAYKLSAWIRIAPDFSGADWGGIVVSAVHHDWSQTYQSEFFSPANRPVGEWFQEIFTFIPSQGRLRVRVGFFGGPGWSAHFHVDDVALRPLAGQNEPPRIEAFDVSPLSGPAPLTVSAAVVASDGDGAVVLIRHETGDGAVRTGAQVAHTFGLGGVYNWRVTVTDDQGATAQDSVRITVIAAGPHAVTITAPTAAESWTTHEPAVVLAGRRGGGAGPVYWINERTGQAAEAAAQDSFETAPIALARGRNPLRVQSRAPDGGIRTDLLTVTRMVPGATGPAFGPVVWPAGVTGVNEPWECRFDLETAAENPGMAYDPDPPAHLEGGAGLTVDAIFDGPTGELVQPAWLDMEIERDGSRLRATGRLRWTVRMAFPAAGRYGCRLRARDAWGETELTGPEVAVAPSEYTGFLRVSAGDSRYFEYDDGEPFFPLGYATGIGGPAETDEEITRWRANGLNFSRLWLSAVAPFSDPWSSWATHHAMPANGYLPPSLRTSEERFDQGDFTWKLAAPVVPGVQTPAMFRGFWDGATPVRPNTVYRVTARVRTRGMTGGGLRLKTGGWLGEAVTQSGVGDTLGEAVRGDAPWCYLWGDYRTGPGETTLPNLYLVLEECTGGAAYCHRITVQEVLPGGELGGNILPGPDADSHLFLDPIRSANFDYLARAASAAGVHYKVVILEKNDWLLNQFDAWGQIDPMHAVFDAPADTKLRRLYEHYWRHLCARWGAEPSIHSWELVNEGAPGSYAELTDALAEWFDACGPRPRMASTSFWCCWEPEYWSGSTADYGDVHAYIMTTGWIDTVRVDGELYDRAALVEDPAAALWAYSTAVGGDPLRTKPVILSETDLDQPGNQSPDPRLAADSLGMWLHDFNWAHLNPGGMPALIWDAQNIRRHDLHHQYRGLRAFAQGIDWTTGDYRSAEAVCAHPRMRAWGQRRADGSAAHLWVSHRDHTWARVLAQGPPEPISGTVTLAGLRPGPLGLEVWSTNDTLPAQIGTVEVGADGRCVLEVPDLAWDRAYRLGYDGAGVVPEPDPGDAFTLRARPRPAPRPVLELGLPRDGRLRLEIHDLAGRRVRALADVRLPAGTHRLTWDGLDSGGRPAPAGVYYARARWAGSARSVRVVLLR